jgi:hypothetical protein
MSRRQAADDRNGWIEKLAGFARTQKPADTPARQRPYVRPPSRAHRAPLTTWQDAAAIKALKHLAVEEGCTVQALVAEGINMLLEKRGRPTVAS